MNTQTAATVATTTSPAAPAAAPTVPVARHMHRQRDYGVGYGNSSGYASNRSYASNWVQPRFRFA